MSARMALKAPSRAPAARREASPTLDAAAPSSANAVPHQNLARARQARQASPPGEVGLDTTAIAQGTQISRGRALLGARFPVRLGGIVKTFRFEPVDGVWRLGVNPGWMALNGNIDRITAIIEAATKKKPGQPARVSKAEWRAFYKKVDEVLEAEDEYNSALDDREEAQANRDDSNPRPKKRTRLNPDEQGGRAQVNAAVIAFEAAVMDLIHYTREKFQNLIDENSTEAENLLGTSGRVLAPLAAAAAAPLTNYRTGADQTNAIPIVWYKPVSAYKAITPRSATGASLTVQPFADFYIRQRKPVAAAKTLFKSKPNKKRKPQAGPTFYASTAGGLGADDAAQWKFGVEAANRPDNAAFSLKKTKHESKRTNQKLYNGLFDNVGVTMGVTTQLDGDHVKDLGFGGQDELDNYWPLDATINRRAFDGYNGGYKVHFIQVKNGVQELKMQAIGFMYGKYFKVKASMPETGGTVPAESGLAKAGTITP